MDFSQWWDNLILIEKIYWIFAFPSSLAFLIILAFTFLGGSADMDGGDADADIDGDDGIGFQFFTIKNLVAFFAIFSWTGLACIDSGYPNFITIVISVVSGLIMMTIMASIFYFMGKLTESGTMDLTNAIGKLGEIYLTVPAKRSGFGKVQINVQGSLRELQAMTDDDVNLTQGMVIEVVNVIDDHILLVRKSG